MLDFILAACFLVLVVRAAEGAVFLMWAVSAPVVDTSRRVSTAVSVLIPCFNEEKVLEATLAAVYGSQGVDLHSVICIDDGSTDGTLTLACSLKGRYGKTLKVITQKNLGKALALNRGLGEVVTPYFVCIDADTLVFPETLRHLVGSFVGNVAAVSGNMIVGGGAYCDSAICRSQKIEYELANNIERRALSKFCSVPVVPGAVSAFSTRVVRRLGGFSNRTLAEDTDITMLLLSNGYGTLYQPAALAVTEVPVTLSQLYAQRLRWSTGKLQVAALLARDFWRRGGRSLMLWLYMILNHCMLPALFAPFFILFMYCLVMGARDVGVNSGLVWFSLSAFLLCCLVGFVQRQVTKRMAGTDFFGSQRSREWAYFIVLAVGYVSTWHALFSVLIGSTVRWSKLTRRGDVQLPMARRDNGGR